MLFLISLCLLGICHQVAGDCNSGCKEPTLLYEDLGCKPVFTSTEDCCPSKYDCPHIENRPKNEEKCYFHGKAYSPGESLNDDEIYGNCQTNCFCRKKESGNMGFTCAVLDCPEWLGTGAKAGCHLKYEPNKCCSTGEVCPPFSTTCAVGDKIYREGQRFDAPDTKCVQCVCQKGFKGKFEAPFCMKRTCGDEVRRQPEIKNFCAPSYITLDDCCPFHWICPENDTIALADRTADKPDRQCRFGEKRLNIGDKFERTHGDKGKVSCECRIPPYLTCIQNYEYPAYAPEY